MAVLRYGMRNDPPGRVALQRFLNAHDWRPELPLLQPLGNYLDQTKHVVRLAQQQCGITGPDADGSIVGPRTISAFSVRGARW